MATDDFGSVPIIYRYTQNKSVTLLSKGNCCLKCILVNIHCFKHNKTDIHYSSSIQYSYIHPA